MATSTATSAGSGNVSSSATATGGNGSITNGITGGIGGAALANSTATSSGTGAVSSLATASGGGGGINFGGTGSAGGAAFANSAAASTGLGSIFSSASATGGAGGGGFISFGASGSASAQSTGQNASGLVVTTAQSPAAASAASAMTSANIGVGFASLVNINPGQTVSNATLTPAGPSIGVGAMSAGYGGSGKSLTNQTTAAFTFAANAPEELFLTLLDDNSSGLGFDKLKFQVTVDGTIEVLDTFTSLNVAEAFFSDNRLDLGLWGAGEQTVDVSYWLTASETGAGFGFAYNIAATPEPSTWAMMLVGFASLGYAGYRRARGLRAA
jgi:hypothetical protein